MEKGNSSKWGDCLIFRGGSRRLTIFDRALLIAATVLLMWYSPLATPYLYWTKAAGLILIAASCLLQRQRPVDFLEAAVPSGAAT